MADIQILVTPEMLEAKSGEVERKVQIVREKFAQMNDMMNRTTEYWIGEGGDKHRETYKKFESDIDEIIKRLAEHPRDLLTMAGIYRKAETTNVSTTSALASDVIQ